MSHPVGQARKRPLSVVQPAYGCRFTDGCEQRHDRLHRKSYILIAFSPAKLYVDKFDASIR